MNYNDTKFMLTKYQYDSIIKMLLESNTEENFVKAKEYLDKSFFVVEMVGNNAKR